MILLYNTLALSFGQKTLVIKNALSKLRENGFTEIALNPNHLKILLAARILEGHSSDGFEEVPEIPQPRTYAITNKLIQIDQTWAIDFDWCVFGKFAKLLNCGYWKCKIYFEQMGGGECHHSPETQMQDLGRPGQRYRGRIDIRPNSGTSGVYRVIACL